MQSSPILEIRKINKTYSGIRVLHNIDFLLMPAEVHALVGENGAGKSTLIKILAGVVEPDECGEIYFQGSRILHMTAARSIHLGISVIYQDTSLFPNLSIAENICKGLYSDVFVDWKKINGKASEILKEMGVEIDVREKLCEISIGKRQLIAIARAITFDSKVIIMDEPTAALSSSEVEMLYGIIRMLRSKGVAIVYISHKLDEVFNVADRITVLRDGELIQTAPASEFDQMKLINMMVGRELRFVPMHNQSKAGEVLFEVKQLTEEPSFRDISFSCRRGEIVGLTGLVGAGRSELAQSIFGLTHPQSGEILLHGIPLKIKNANDAIRKGVCYLPEDRRSQGLFQKHSMVRNITAVTLKKQLKHGLINAQIEQETAEKYIRDISIRPQLPHINVESLSGGNQQKALISRWLNADPKLLIVDEPTTGVDVGAKLEIHRLLRKLAERGVCVILISSDLSEVFALSDRILVMRQGRIVNEVAVGEATQEGILQKGLLG